MRLHLELYCSCLKFQDVASKNVDRISGEVQNQIGAYGNEAMKNLENAREDAARKITEFSKNFEGTANDLSNYANTQGQESLDDVQQWFKDKLVFFGLHLSISEIKQNSSLLFR